MDAEPRGDNNDRPHIALGKETPLTPLVRAHAHLAPQKVTRASQNNIARPSAILTTHFAPSSPLPGPRLNRQGCPRARSYCVYLAHQACLEPDCMAEWMLVGAPLAYTDTALDAPPMCHYLLSARHVALVKQVDRAVIRASPTPYVRGRVLIASGV